MAMNSPLKTIALTISTISRDGMNIKMYKVTWYNLIFWPWPPTPVKNGSGAPATHWRRTCYGPATSAGGWLRAEKSEITVMLPMSRWLNEPEILSSTHYGTAWRYCHWLKMLLKTPRSLMMFHRKSEESFERHTSNCRLTSLAITHCARKINVAKWRICASKTNPFKQQPVN